MDACHKWNVEKAKCILSEEGTGQGKAESAPVGHNHRDLRERGEEGRGGGRRTITSVAAGRNR